MQWIPSVIYHFSILGKNYTAILEKSIMLFLSFKWWWLLSEITAWNSFVELSCLACLLQLEAACIELDFKVIYSMKHSLIFFFQWIAVFQEIWSPSLDLLKFQAQKNVSKMYIFIFEGNR